jgi:hypothetical protein
MAKTEKVPLHIIGVTPLLQNRDDLNITDPSAKKTKNESYEEHEERVWRQKAHYNVDKQVIFPNTWIRKSLIASQGRNGNPIKPANSRKASDTLLRHFISGVMVDDSVIRLNGKPITEKELVSFKKMVSPQGKGKVLCIRPMIPIGWELDIEILIIDEMIRSEHVIQSLEWAGKFNGVGDWRPQKGGVYGMFEVK